jgi:hypothetical protein
MTDFRFDELQHGQHARRERGHGPRKSARTKIIVFSNETLHRSLMNDDPCMVRDTLIEINDVVVDEADAAG